MLTIFESIEKNNQGNPDFLGFFWGGNSHFTDSVGTGGRIDSEPCAAYTHFDTGSSGYAFIIGEIGCGLLFFRPFIIH